VKQLAMRRTLFVFPRDLVAAALASSSARVAEFERRRMAKELVAAGVAIDGNAWLDRAAAEVLTALADSPAGLSAAEVRRRVPMIDVTIAGSPGETWSAPQVLTLIGATGEIIRGASVGGFPTARPLWTLPEHWLGGQIAMADAASGYRELVRRWLYSFGPGTEDDLVWWLGATKTIVRTALADVDAVAVELQSGGTGWLLPDDLREVLDPGPWTSLLPPLDPTVMGWRDRGFFLGAHHAELFDTRGNAGTTAWVDGHIVGCWTQDVAGTVHVHLLEPVSERARYSLAEQAASVTRWVGDERVPTGYLPPAVKRFAAERPPAEPVSVAQRRASTASAAAAAISTSS
jgi:hypothetical protein